MYPATIYCQEEDYEEYIAAAAGHLSESDCQNEAKRLKSMDLSFEFGCSLDLAFIREKWNRQMWSVHQKRWHKSWLQRKQQIQRSC